MAATIQFDEGAFGGMALNTIREQVTREGWDPAVIRDRPGFVYPPHQHPEAKLLAFLDGSMRVQAGGRTYECRPGDRLVIPGEVEHAAEVDPEGCSFLWSEQLREAR